MRCPKFGYISFDYQESCVKCRKDIGDAVRELHGTAYDAAPPLFLQFAPRTRAGSEAAGVAATVGDFLMGDQDAPDREDSGEEIALDDISFDEPAEQEEIVLAEELPAPGLSLEDEDGISFELNESEVAPTVADREVKVPTLDFGELDISDLAPPTLASASESSIPEEEPVREPALAAVAESVEGTVGSGLEDLQFHDLNLETPDKLAAATATDRPPTRPVRTGTALDNFQIDLGELFAENKK